MSWGRDSHPRSWSLSPEERLPSTGRRQFQALMAEQTWAVGGHVTLAKTHSLDLRFPM